VTVLLPAVRGRPELERAPVAGAQLAAVPEALETREEDLSAVTKLLDKPGDLQNGALVTSSLPKGHVMTGDPLGQDAAYFPAFGIRIYSPPSQAQENFSRPSAPCPGPGGADGPTRNDADLSGLTVVGWSLSNNHQAGWWPSVRHGHRYAPLPSGPRGGVSAPGGGLDPIPPPNREDKTMQDTVDQAPGAVPPHPRRHHQGRAPGRVWPLPGRQHSMGVLILRRRHGRLHLARPSSMHSTGAGSAGRDACRHCQCHACGRTPTWSPAIRAARP